MMEKQRDRTEAGEQPSDTERLVGETAASEPLATGMRVQPPERESRDASNAAGTPPDIEREESSGGRLTDGPGEDS